MARRIVSAREQVEMLSPWRTAAEDPTPPSIHDIMPGRFSDGNGRWDYRHQETSGDRYPRHEYGIHPISSPASHSYVDHWGKTHTVHYDPALTGGQLPRPGKFGHEWDDHSALRNEITELAPPPGMLWRGMSREEYERSRERGYFESEGGHNFDSQQGLTFFSTKPEQAANYATWFAPLDHTPTFTHPGYVVGVPDRPDAPRGAIPGQTEIGSTEVGLSGRIPFSEATHHYVGQVSTLRPGTQGVSEGWHGWEESGGSHPSSTIVWSQMIGTPAPKVAAADGWGSLSHEDRVSVAENVMERSGFGGKIFHVPTAYLKDAEERGMFDDMGRPDAHTLQRQHSAEAEDFVNGVLESRGYKFINPQPYSVPNPMEGQRIKVNPEHWDLREPGSGQAFTDGYSQIALKGNHVNTLTLLHEVAHVLHGTRHEDGSREGHGPNFQKTLRDLYHEHLGPEAASIFSDILEPPDAHTAARRLAERADDLRWERDSSGNWILVTRNPDGNPVAVRTERAPSVRTSRRTAMPAPLPKNTTFHYHPTQETVPGHIPLSQFNVPGVEARVNGNTVGWLCWTDGSPEDGGRPVGEINDVYVSAPRRHHGIATALFDFARQHEPQVHHSDTLSDAGRKWRDYEQSRHAHRTAAATQWYHTSPHRLPVGTELTPGGGRSPHDPYYRAVGEPDRRNHVWVEDDPRLLKRWHDIDADANYHYRVEPVDGNPRPYRDGDHSQGWVVPRARIVEDLGPAKRRRKGHIATAAGKSAEQHLRDTYEPYPPGSPNLPDSLKPHLMLPTDIAHHYREYDRPDDENTQMLKRVIADQGIRQPLKISTDGNHALMIEGNHRINVARQLGMTHVPVQVFLEKPGKVMTNSEGSRPVPLEPVLANWIDRNRHTLRSFWD